MRHETTLPLGAFKLAYQSTQPQNKIMIKNSYQKPSPQTQEEALKLQKAFNVRVKPKNRLS